MPSLDILRITVAISSDPHRCPGHDVNSIADCCVLHAHDRPSHVRALRKGSIDHVRHMQRTGACALEDRSEGPDVNLTALELPINEELEANLLALHEVFTIVGVKKMSSSCFETASVFDLKSHPKTGTRER